MPQPAVADAEGRDLRLDLLRGLFVARMILVHLNWNSVWIRWPFGFVTAAEGFFLVSGITLGKVAFRYHATGRAADLERRLWLRAGWLWLANTALVLLFRALSGTCANPAGDLDWFWRETPRWQRLLSFDQPSVLHVLPRYVVFLLAAPFVLRALRSGWRAAVALVSIGLWLLHSVFPEALKIPWFELDRATLPVAAWQLLFVGGILLGYRPARVAADGAAARRRWLLTALSAGLAAGFVVFERFALPGLVANHADAIGLWLGREVLAPARLLNLAAVGWLLWALASRFERALVRTVGPVLLPLGQNALAAFLLHVLLSWAIQCITGPAGTLASPLVVALCAWAGLALVTLGVRQRGLVRLLAPI